MNIEADSTVKQSLSPTDLTSEQIIDIRLAASQMSGAQRRIFVADMSLKYCHGRARFTENIFSWSRETIKTGLGERRTGISCIGLQSNHCGNKRWEEKHPEMAEFLCQRAETDSQQDPTFKSDFAFTRLTARLAHDALKSEGYNEVDIPSLSSLSEILNRLGYRLRKVVKAKPLKKIKETDAIFDNVRDKNQQAQASKEKVKRLSIDCKATVKTGELSRGGVTRGNNQATDHDFSSNGSYTPCGIVDEDTGQLYINIGSSYKTSDFIIDTLFMWWNCLALAEHQSIDKIQLKMDNGSESSGSRTWFLKRIVEFSDEIGKPIQLLYYPPYHSKYNPIERCWGILELHWNGTLLSNVAIMVAWAKTMFWKGLHPVVQLSDKIYKKGLRLTKKMMRPIEKRLKRHPDLPKWDIYIEPITVF